MITKLDEAASASLPIIDFAPFLHGSQREKVEVGQKLVAAFKDVGFIYLINHSIPRETIDEAFSWMNKFFNLPLRVRLDPAVMRPGATPESKTYTLRGYNPVGAEKISQGTYSEEGLLAAKKVVDVRDLFDCGADVGPPSVREPNRFPPEEAIPGFKDFSLEFFWTCHRAGMDLFRAVALGLGLDEDYFVNVHRDADHILRYHHYPATERLGLVDETKARVQAHTDYGSMTLLFQDAIGGLQVEDAHQPGHFVPAPHIPGAAIVNVGDFLQLWTNDVLRSTLHRVVAPEADDGSGMVKERFSIPFFLQADRDTIVRCAPGLEGRTGPKYPPLTAKEHLYKRTATQYTDALAQEEDVATGKGASGS